MPLEWVSACPEPGLECDSFLIQGRRLCWLAALSRPSLSENLKETLQNVLTLSPVLFSLGVV